MMVSERAPSAMVVSPAPISPLAPIRLSTPMIRKFSSPFWALRSRMSLEGVQCGDGVQQAVLCTLPLPGRADAATWRPR